MRATAAESGRIAPKFLEEEQRLGELMFCQEYGCEFGDAEDVLFDAELIERAMTDSFGELKW